MIKFKCPKCGHDVIEEIASGATISYDVKDVTLSENGTDVEFDYSSDISVGSLDEDSIRRQCGECGKLITEDMLKSLAASDCYPVSSTIGYHGREGKIRKYLNGSVIIQLTDTDEELSVDIDEFLEQQTR